MSSTQAVPDQELHDVTRQIEALLGANKALPPDLHERALRLQLETHPDEPNCIYSLISLLHLSGRAPMPDDAILACGSPVPFAEPGDLDRLVHSVPTHFLNDDVWGAYTALWQAAIRHPDSALPWATYALSFAERNEWPYASLAAARTLQHSGAREPQAANLLLDALSTMAEYNRLSDLAWQEWFDSLPSDIRAQPAYSRLLLAVGRDSELGITSATSLETHPRDARVALLASIVAYRNGDLARCYDMYFRALKIDVKEILPSSIQRYSAQLDRAVHLLGKDDELADWLSAVSSEHAELNMLPEAKGIELRAKSRRQRQVALDRGLPSPLLITQAKSGSVSVGRIFASGFALPSVLYSFITTRVVMPWLQDYLLGGACYVTHLRPTVRNRELLRAGDATNVIVHIRDPRQVMISSAEHERIYTQQLSSTEVDAAKAGTSDLLERAIDKHLLPAIAWIDGWFEASQSMNIHFTTFEEMISDRAAFYDRILGHYGGDTQHFDRSAATEDQPNIDYHRRLGEVDEWRRRLSPGQIDRVNRAIPDRLWRRFNWEP